MMIKKKLSIVMAAMLIVSLLLGSVNSFAAFNAGENTQPYNYNGGSGTVMAMADVTANAGGTYYKYKGDMDYSSATTLKIHVKGYYSSSGTTRPIERENTASGAKTATIYASVPSGATGVCTTSKPCVATGYVKSTRVKTVQYPK